MEFKPPTASLKLPPPEESVFYSFAKSLLYIILFTKMCSMRNRQSARSQSWALAATLRQRSRFWGRFWKIRTIWIFCFTYCTDYDLKKCYKLNYFNVIIHHCWYRPTCHWNLCETTLLEISTQFQCYLRGTVTPTALLPAPSVDTLCTSGDLFRSWTSTFRGM